MDLKILLKALIYLRVSLNSYFFGEQLRDSCISNAAFYIKIAAPEICSIMLYGERSS